MMMMIIIIITLSEVINNADRMPGSTLQ